MLKKIVSKTYRFLHKLRKPALRIVRRAADSPLPEVTFVTTFVLSRWWLNSDFSYPSEIIVPILLLSFLAIIAFYIYRFILGPGLATHVAALLLTYFFYSYRFIHDHNLVRKIWEFIPSPLSTEITQSLLLFLVAVLVCGALGWAAARATRRYSFVSAFQPYKILLFAVAFIFCIQLSRFTQRYIEIKDALGYQYQSELLKESSSAVSTAKPNIYYFVFDRYGNPEQLKNRLDIDNSQIVKFMADSDFVNHESAYANYPFTMSSVSSTMAMTYFDDFKEKFGDGYWQAAFPYRSIFNNPPIVQILKKDNYKFNNVSSWWDFARVRVNADSDPAKSFRLNVLNQHKYFSDLERDILYKSFLWSWLKKGASVGDFTIARYELDRHPRDNFHLQMESVKDIARVRSSQPHFTFVHALIPHPPYVFDSNGNYPAYNGEANDEGADERDKYYDAVKYANVHIKEVVNHIKYHDPEAVIIFQADEGPYPKEFRFEQKPEYYYNPLDLSPEKMRQKFSVQSHHFFPGVSAEEALKAKSPVNIFRFVLNHYLGYRLPYLPDCNMSNGNKYKIYNYEVVNETLTGQPAPQDCRLYE